MLSPEPNWSEITLTIATVVMAVATVALAIGALLALLAIGEARRARHAEAMTEAGRRWNEPAFRTQRAKVKARIDKVGAEAFKDEMMKLRDSEDEEHAEKYYGLLAIPDYFEDLAILVKYHAITFRIVDDSLGTTVVRHWGNWWPFIRELRVVLGDPKTYEHFQRLAEDISRTGEHGET
ncbi:Uncharacterised protein [Mycolicibacterium fortuitum]|uniref:DUF4760 domain-containing protein n=1 Tax=Mycolicibacterium fortuitum TaxID=1766 RepID=A0A378UXX7_MYCFO|nr:Uncharacterised protein [Mycolicibacterium fortuitum]